MHLNEWVVADSEGEASSVFKASQDASGECSEQAETQYEDQKSSLIEGHGPKVNFALYIIILY